MPLLADDTPAHTFSYGDAIPQEPHSKRGNHERQVFMVDLQDITSNGDPGHLPKLLMGKGEPGQ